MIFSALFHFVLDSMPHSVSKSVNISAHIFGWNIQTKSNIPFDWHFRYRVLSDAFPVRLPFQASCRPINNLYTENGVGISWAWGEQDCTQSRWGSRTAFRIEQNFHVRTLSVVLCYWYSLPFRLGNHRNSWFALCGVIIKRPETAAAAALSERDKWFRNIFGHVEMIFRPWKIPKKVRIHFQSNCTKQSIGRYVPKAIIVLCWRLTNQWQKSWKYLLDFN